MPPPEQLLPLLVQHQPLHHYNFHLSELKAADPTAEFGRSFGQGFNRNRMPPGRRLPQVVQYRYLQHPTFINCNY